jgi:hypothetical protein
MTTDADNDGCYYLAVAHYSQIASGVCQYCDESEDRHYRRGDESFDPDQCQCVASHLAVELLTPVRFRAAESDFRVSIYQCRYQSCQCETDQRNRTGQFEGKLDYQFSIPAPVSTVDLPVEYQEVLKRFRSDPEWTVLNPPGGFRAPDPFQLYARTFTTRLGQLGRVRPRRDESSCPHVGPTKKKKWK